MSQEKKTPAPQQEKKPYLTDKLAKTLGFNDAKSFVAKANEHKGKVPIGFADTGTSLEDLLASSPATQGGSISSVVGGEGGNVDALTASIPSDTATGADKATADLSGESVKEHEEKESSEKEKAEEAKAAIDPKSLIVDIKAIIEGAEVKKEVKSKGEQAIVKLEELQKAIDDAQSFLKDNPAVAAEMEAK
jgi:hypothetical protein